MQSIELLDENFGNRHRISAICIESELFTKIKGSLRRLTGLGEKIKQKDTH